LPREGLGLKVLVRRGSLRHGGGNAARTRWWMVSRLWASASSRRQPAGWPGPLGVQPCRGVSTGRCPV